jgi:Rod binding protein
MNEISGINLMQAQRIMPGSMSRLRSVGAAGVGGAGDAVDRERDAYNLVMGRAQGSSAKATPKERARKAAEQLVAITFVRPILEEMRRSNNAAPPFGPSSGEKQFRSFLDAKLANEITHSAQFPLVDRIARDLNREPVLPESMTRRPVGRMT